MSKANEATDSELSLRLHQELNGLPRRRRNSPPEAASPGASLPSPPSKGSAEKYSKRPVLLVSDNRQDFSTSPPTLEGAGADAEETPDGDDLTGWPSKRQRSPVTPDSLPVGWVKKPRPLDSSPSGRESDCDTHPAASNGQSSASPFLDSEQEAAAKVRKTLAIYNHERLRQVVLETERVKRDGGCKRADLKTLSTMIARKQVLHRNTKVIGRFPGVKVGDSFYERAQLCAIGLHTPTMAGIDTISAKESPHGESVATSIVLAGGYEDDRDYGDHFIYTGAGGNNIRGDRRQGGHQTLTGVNRALANSGRFNVPVRVFRGFEETVGNSKFRVFTYDGLYQCSEAWIQKGKSGFDVVKFRMQREAEQPPLSSQQVYFVRVRGSLPKDMEASDRPGLISSDISGGKERIPVCLVNDVVKEETADPPAIEYVARMDYQQQPGPACNCTSPEDCANSETCACARRNTFGFPYVEGGRLKETGQGVVYECGPGCGCGDRCSSRVAQKGITHRLEVFRTRNRGYGVRSWDFIQVGSFITEYTGRILTDEQAHGCDDDTYLFNIDPSTDGLVGLELVEGGSASQVHSAAFSIDALREGNVGRFVNHSCTPNAVIQSVCYDHHNPSLSHICLFAYDNIPPGREITYDYNYKVGTVIGADEVEKVLECRCGNRPPVCKGRLY